ncbi:MAG: thioredoxin family protein [Bacteroidota bacterium]
MAQTASQMVPLGTLAPEFQLLDVRTNQLLTWQDVRSEVATLVMFICNHCPYVKHVQPELVRLAHDYMPKGISVVAISSNDAEKYPDDSPEKMKELADHWQYPFPYLYDETQEVARAYDAACTPDFYVFDKDMRLVYRGQLDDARPKNDLPLTGKDIRQALDCLLAGKPVPQDQKPGIGCNIKWK